MSQPRAVSIRLTGTVDSVPGCTCALIRIQAEMTGTRVLSERRLQHNWEFATNRFLSLQARLQGCQVGQHILQIRVAQFPVCIRRHERSPLMIDLRKIALEKHMDLAVDT